jgi:hypothetical protein
MGFDDLLDDIAVPRNHPLYSGLDGFYHMIQVSRQGIVLNGSAYRAAAFMA